MKVEKILTTTGRTAKVWAYGCPHAPGNNRIVTDDPAWVAFLQPETSNCDNGQEAGISAGVKFLTQVPYWQPGPRVAVVVFIDADTPPTRVGGDVEAMGGIHWAQGKRHISVGTVPARAVAVVAELSADDTRVDAGYIVRRVVNPDVLTELMDIAKRELES